jgi:hypothetical protein
MISMPLSNMRVQGKSWKPNMGRVRRLIDAEQPDAGRHRDERHEGGQYQSEEVDRYVLEDAFVHQMPSGLKMRRIERCFE